MAEKAHHLGPVAEKKKGGRRSFLAAPTAHRTHVRCEKRRARPTTRLCKKPGAGQGNFAGFATFLSDRAFPSGPAAPNSGSNPGKPPFQRSHVRGDAKRQDSSSPTAVAMPNGGILGRPRPWPHPMVELWCRRGRGDWKWQVIGLPTAMARLKSSDWVLPRV